MSWRFQPNANLMKCRWSRLWWLALCTLLHRAVKGPVWTESMNKRVHGWPCGIFNSLTTSRCDHKRLDRKLGFGLLLFQRDSPSPPSFSPSQKPSLFSVSVSPCKTQIVAGMSSAFCLTPWFPVGLPIICKCHSACCLISVSQLCPRCDTLVTNCKAGAVPWATGAVLLMAVEPWQVTPCEDQAHRAVFCFGRNK